MMTVELYQFPRAMNSPNASPFCMKLETYLRMANLEYIIREIVNPRQAPNGKVPFVKINGKPYNDSRLIIDHLETVIDHPVQAGLTERERALTLTSLRMMEEHLYWAIVHSRWIDPVGVPMWKAGFKDLITMPGFLFNILFKRIQKHVQQELKGQGTGLLTQEAIYQMAIHDIDALSILLGKRHYYFDKRPTLLDAGVYSYVSSIINTPWHFPLKSHTLKQQNLLDHYDRMMQRYFSDINYQLANKAQ